VLSSFGRRFLEVLGKLDQLMPLLQTLEIHEVITAQAVDIQRASLKRQVRDVANGARNLATGLRRRMNSMGAPAAPAGVQNPDVVAPVQEATGDVASVASAPDTIAEVDVAVVVK